MPITRDLFWNSPEFARTFVCSPSGILMHEIAHYVASNVDGPVGGHLIVSNSKHGGGAFVMDDASVKRLDRDTARIAFILASGSVAELYFCNQTNVNRLKSDIDAYRSLVTSYRDSTDEDVVSIWQNNYLARLRSISKCIEYNYDRCMVLLAANRFLLNETHVIPTCVLRPPRIRSVTSWLDEIVWTVSKKTRMKALSEYVERNRDLTLSKKSSFVSETVAG